MLLVLLKMFFMKINCVLFRIKIIKSHEFVFLQVYILTVHTFCYICINGIFLTSFLIMNCLLLLIWKLLIKNFVAIYLFTTSQHLDAKVSQVKFLFYKFHLHLLVPQNKDTVV